MTKLARIALVAALLAGPVFMMATPASATGNIQKDTESDVTALFDQIKTAGFWDLILKIGRVVGIAVVLLVTSKQLFNAAKSGAGIMTAVPAIIVAFIVGGFLINLNAVMSIVSWGTSVVSSAMDGMGGIFKGP